MPKKNVVHIMPHMGGGVGKAMVSLVDGTKACVQHAFILLESPANRQFLDRILDSGCEVMIQPSGKFVNSLISKADIVQLEWWNHPALFSFLCSRYLPPFRMLAWCHVSGLHSPVIPAGLVGLAECFIFTSRCSLQAENIRELTKQDRDRLGVVSSGVGFSGVRYDRQEKSSKLCFGYMGSLNFSKLHPDFIEYLSCVTLNDFHVQIWGDESYKEPLLAQCRESGRAGLISFRGYTVDPETVLKDIDIFVYLLNPTHYGTAENVLLEAMSVGAVPIVINNPAESILVEDGKTGLIVRNKSEFSAAISWLYENQQEMRRMSENASRMVAQKYTPEVMGDTMNGYYDRVLSCTKNQKDFSAVLGHSSYEWFMACRHPKEIERIHLGRPDRVLITEDTKGSLKHFADYFPEDLDLKQKLSNLTCRDEH